MDACELYGIEEEEVGSEPEALERFTTMLRHAREFGSDLSDLFTHGRGQSRSKLWQDSRLQCKEDRNFSECEGKVYPGRFSLASHWRVHPAKFDLSKIPFPSIYHWIYTERVTQGIYLSHTYRRPPGFRGGSRELAGDFEQLRLGLKVV